MTLSRDERLALWLDGEMDAEQATAFEAEIAADPELAAMVEEWRGNDALIAGAFAPVADQPIDDELLERLGLVERTMPQAANDNPPWWKRHRLPLGGALAASFAAALLLVPRGGTAPQDPLSLALDRTPSLAQASLPDGSRLVPTLTVRAADGRWCREFAQGGEVALACRGAEGRWSVEARARGTTPVTGEGYAVASGADSGALQAAYDRIGAADALDAAAEANLIAKKWGGHP